MMSERINVLVVDDNIQFGDLLYNYLNQYEDIKVLGVARDGLQAVEMIKQLKPDMVILDIIMPGLDGIGVLEKMNTIQLEKKPMFIVLTAIGQDVFIHKAILLGADYYIVKPFNVDILVSRIRQAYKDKHASSFSNRNTASPATQIEGSKTDPANEIEIYITNLMHEIGIPPNLSGYQYIREAVLQTLKGNEKEFFSVTKYLYPVVAEKFNTSPQKVERAIRKAIEVAWTKGNMNLVRQLPGYQNKCFRGRPTNSEFIAALSDKVRMFIKQKKKML
ncbi:MAG TPA: sporulation transcription factor Spo0A [Clostridiaceae bacterium]|nr:sporulation transcription factor Spo0A [Clostridiaceae bacterium]